MKHAPYFVPSPFADLSSTWLSACMQPWAMWQGWTQVWLKSVGSMPSAWLPALAAERKNQPAAIDFFLPWMPRVEAVVMPLDGHSSEDAMRVMLRAVLPFVAGQGRESVLVDAKVSRHKGEAQLRDITPASAVLPPVAAPKSDAGVAAPAKKAAPAPAVAKVSAPKAATAKTGAEKAAPRRTRKPAPDTDQG